MDRVTNSKAALDLKIVDILRQHEVAISILKEYPDGLERFKLAINNETMGSPSPLQTQTQQHPTYLAR
jgi:hypothetical protein